MEMTCAFAGQRPSSFRFGYDEEHPDCVKLKLLMAAQIASLIDNGVTTFLTGMALGADIWGAQIVLALKTHRPDLRLIAVLPCENQADRWSPEQRERYFDILAQCNETVYISRHYTRDCMFKRNRWLIDHANFVLAVYNGEVKGSAANSVRYAYRQSRAIIVIDPNMLLVHPYTILVSPDQLEGKHQGDAQENIRQ
jgi:uncharacterized phage-like protein YoqJ